MGHRDSVLQMVMKMSQDYLGMTFVYGKEEELDGKLVAIVKILLKMGFKWLWCECGKGGYGLEWDRDRYILRKYGVEDINRLIVYSGAEWLAKVEAKEIKWIEDKELICKINDYHKQEDEIILYSIPFPPVKYYEECGIRYDREKPFPPDELIINEDGNKVEVYGREAKGKRAIIVDFWSLHRYFEFSDPPLSRAVEDFAVDLMRDIASATKPVYAYMNREEFKPLEYDPMCRNMKEMVKLVRSEGIYTVWSDILWVPKNAILNEFSMEELKTVEGVTGRKWEIVVEEHDDHLFLYPTKSISNYEYVEYRYKNRRKEEAFLRELHDSLWLLEGRDIIEDFCGDANEGLVLNIRAGSGAKKDEVMKVIKRVSRKHKVSVKEVKFIE